MIKLSTGQPEIRVHPTLIPKSVLLANVNGVFNAVAAKGDMVGETMFYGPGAGQDATASAVTADIVDICLDLANDSTNRIRSFRAHGAYNTSVVPMDDIETRYYLRMSLQNASNVLSKVTSILGNYDISIASVSQTEQDGDFVPVIFITQSTIEGKMLNALKEIQALDIVQDEPVMIRIEDFS